MKFLIVKVKDRDLYFNADEMEGAYVCDTPMLMDKAQADSIMQYANELYNYDTDEQFTNDQLEIKEVELNIL
jgi:ABC-type transport system involved in Fe-S cluster assembly fused permease/ATPase subunit